MRHFSSLLLALFICVSANAQITESAVDAVRNMGVGWNLGNTLDANKTGGKDFTQDSYWGGQGLESENFWGQPTTTSSLISMMKNAGFGAIRVPATWFNHMDPSGKVNAEWMARVHQVVDYVIGNGLYCILNVHHDTGADNDSHTSWIKADEDNYNANKDRYEYLWKQIAEEFKDYDNHLVFEGYNEMLDIKSSWCFASFNASGQYDAAIATSAYNGINGYAQSFVTSVRNTGGNNASRNLIINTYAAANGYGTWNSHLKDVFNKMIIPDDTAEGHLIVEVHDYPPIVKTVNSKTVDRPFSEIKGQVDGTIKILKDYLISKGIPVIIGEWGTNNVDAGAGKTDYDVRRDLMLQFVDYYVRSCKENDIATFYWMGLTDGSYRSIPAFSQPDLAETIVKAYHGSDFHGEFPGIEESNSFVAFEGEKVLNWGDGISIPATAFKIAGSSAQLILTYKQSGTADDIQFFYGDWGSKPSFKVDGRSYTGDFIPHSHYGTSTGTEHTTAFTFDNATYDILSQKGLIVHGYHITLYKAELADVTGIADVVAPEYESPVYNLAGQRVSNPSRGIYVKNGKAFFQR